MMSRASLLFIVLFALLSFSEGKAITHDKINVLNETNVNYFVKNVEEDYSMLIYLYVELLLPYSLSYLGSIVMYQIATIASNWLKNG